MKGYIACPNIAPFIKESVLAYHESGMLSKFITTFVQHPDYWLTSTLINLFPKFERELKRRAFAELPFELIKTQAFKEIIRAFAARKLNPTITDWIWEYGELSFDRFVASNLSKEISFVHTYEHAALSTLKRAKQLGILSFYEQPSQHHQLFTTIVKEQIALYPEFNDRSIDLLYDEKAIRRNKRRDNELAMADYVICNSTFTRDSLVSGGLSKKKIILIPYGFPVVEQQAEIPDIKDKVVFLNAGNLNLRKGIHILLQAWKECMGSNSDAELLLVGKNQLPEIFLKDLPPNVKFIPNIPRNELMDVYKQCNVFILPTLADGFGMVISEAMSKGLPVITTHCSGGPDIIEHEKEGLIIPPNDKQAIIHSLNWCLANKHLLKSLGYNAYKRAASYPWSTYRKELIRRINSVSGDKKL